MAAFCSRGHDLWVGKIGVPWTGKNGMRIMRGGFHQDFRGKVCLRAHSSRYRHMVRREMQRGTPTGPGCIGWQDNTRNLLSGPHRPSY
jgi:hypothetical protein